MAIQYPNLPKLSAAEIGGLGGIDLGAAIRSGLENANLYQEAKFKPKQLREETYAKQLANKINETKAEYARQQELANLGYTNSGISLNKANVNRIIQDMAMKKLQQQQEMAFQNLISGGEGQFHTPQYNYPQTGNIINRSGIQNINDYSDNGMSAEGPGPSKSASAYDTFPGRRANTPKSSMNNPSLIDNIHQGLGNRPNEQIIQEGNPNLKNINDVYERYPQYRKKLELLGFKKSQTVNFDPKTGNASIVTTMPNGEIKVSSTGTTQIETPEQKSRREINTKKQEEQNKLDIKRAQQIKEQARDLELAGVDVSGIHDILTGPDSLGTGITKTLIGKLGWGSEKLGEFNERTLRLQAQMTKALSSRGGVGAANIVASGKPNTWKSTSENLGITRAYAERIKNEFNSLNKEYKKITHENLPYTLPEYVRNISKKIVDKTFKPKTSFDSEKDFHNYMKTLTAQQKQIVLNSIRGSTK